MDKRTLAIIAGACFLSSEVASNSSVRCGRSAGAVQNTLVTDFRHDVADFPHSHIDTPDSPNADCTVAWSASGGQADRAAFYVHLVPILGTSVDGQQMVAGYEAIATPDGLPESGTQQMKARFEMDALLSSLDSNLKLPDVQLQLIRDGLLKGERIEIGGHTGVRRFFAGRALRRMGLKISS